MKLIVLACVLPIIIVECAIIKNNNDDREKRDADLKWELLKENVCFHARNDIPGLVPITKNGWLFAAKLEHVSGSIKCSASANASNFGCTEDSTKLSVYVCDDKKQIIFPSKNQTLPYDANKSYHLPAFTANNKEIIFTDFSYPTYIRDQQHITIWNSEDLFNRSENDNSGTVCVKIHGSFVNPLQL